MPAPTAHPATVDLTRTHVTDPVRAVSVGDHTFTGTDVAIHVTHDGHTPSFRVTLWNLTQARWEQLTTGDPVELMLGWRDADVEPVLTGRLTGKTARQRGGDYQYRLTGRSVGGHAVRQRLTASWQDATLQTIGRDLASRLDLDVGYLGTPAGTDADGDWPNPVFDGYTQLRSTSEVRHHLDTLVQRASAQTGVQFEWYVDRGALSIHAKPDFPPQTVRLTTADSIRAMYSHATDTTQTNDVSAWEATGYAHPKFRKQATIGVAATTGGKARQQGGAGTTAARAGASGEDAVTAYRCARYDLTSRTDPGHHTLTAVLVPASARYQAGETP